MNAVLIHGWPALISVGLLAAAASSGWPYAIVTSAYSFSNMFARSCESCLGWVAGIVHGLIIRSTSETVSAVELIAKGKQTLLIENDPQKRVYCGLFDGIFAGYFPPLLLASDSPRGDAITNLFEQYCDWAANLHPSVFSFFLRASLVLGFSTLFCWLAIRQGYRSVSLQSFVFVNSLFLAMVIPVERWQPSHLLIKAWVVTTCAFLTVTLPAVLPLFVAPELGSQSKIRRIVYWIIAGLFITTLLRASSSWKP